MHYTCVFVYNTLNLENLIFWYISTGVFSRVLTEILISVFVTTQQKKKYWDFIYLWKDHMHTSLSLRVMLSWLVPYGILLIRFESNIISLELRISGRWFWFSVWYDRIICTYLFITFCSNVSMCQNMKM